MYEELTAAEKLVMKTIWDHEEQEMSLSEITRYVNEEYGKGWAPQTVSTFLAHLVRKEYVKMKREGRRISYEILIPISSYKAQESRKYVNFWNKGSITDFLSAFYREKAVTPDELKDLKDCIAALDK